MAPSSNQQAAAPSRSIASKLGYHAQRAYVSAMFDILGRLLVAGSLADPVIRGELEGFPEGYTVAFAVLGENLGVRLVRRGPRFELSSQRESRPDLQIMFKHLAHAFALLSFQESTPRAYANGRMVTDGDVALTMRFVRCLDRVQGVILPDLIAARALKSLPTIAARERIRLVALVTSGLIQTYLPRSLR